MKKDLRSLLLLILIATCSFSCITNKRRVLFQNGGFSYNTPTQINNPVEAYKLQSNDVLNIIIKSSDPSADVPYNFADPNANAGNQANGVYLRGYLVNVNGEITLPKLGDIKVSGLSIKEIKALIGEKIKVYLNDATVDVKLAIFQVAVFGEVSRPGLYSVDGNQINILQALSKAGDFTDFANRRNVLLIRKKEDTLETIRINLTSSKVFESDYFYLQPNDQIYVEPLKADNRRANLPLLSTLFSAISTTVLLLNFVTR